jgi:large subunit ribosomal protein L6
MSRVGKHPIDIPSGVNVTLSGQRLTAKGGMGQMEATLMGEVLLTQEGSQIWVRPRDTTTRARMMWGTARTVVANLIQ